MGVRVGPVGVGSVGQVGDHAHLSLKGGGEEGEDLVDTSEWLEQPGMVRRLKEMYEEKEGFGRPCVQHWVSMSVSRRNGGQSEYFGAQSAA